ncbi:MAG: ThaI family type II restriction endonuclease [Ignavibacteria bacterium]|nr:ThaI family type II restriction endonuclease [Ignavibacteria bacterium]
MKKEIRELFDDKVLVKKIQNKLPKLFQIAELESPGAGKIVILSTVQINFTPTG